MLIKKRSENSISIYTTHIQKLKEKHKNTKIPSFAELIHANYL